MVGFRGEIQGAKELVRCCCSRTESWFDLSIDYSRLQMVAYERDALLDERRRPTIKNVLAGLQYA